MPHVQKQAGFFLNQNVFELKIVSKVSVKVFEVQLWLNYVRMSVASTKERREHSTNSKL